MSFANLGLSEKVLEAVRAAGFEIPTPIQSKAIPPTLERRDVLGLAQSGFPRLRVASLQVAEHRDLAVVARTHAESLLDAEGRMVPPRPALTAELEGGWLRRVAAAEPATGA